MGQSTKLFSDNLCHRSVCVLIASVVFLCQILSVEQNEWLMVEFYRRRACKEVRRLRPSGLLRLWRPETQRSIRYMQELYKAWCKKGPETLNILITVVGFVQSSLCKEEHEDCIQISLYPTDHLLIGSSVDHVIYWSDHLWIRSSIVWVILGSNHLWIWSSIDRIISGSNYHSND